MYPEAFFKLHDITEEIIKERIASKTHHGDFIDKIIEVCNDPNSPVSKEMIKAQGSIFFSAGFETTSNCLSTLCYHLALNPDIQEKLREEILGIDADDEINHENISELHYLEAAILENLRIFPPITMQARICKKDAEIKGINIKKGTYVQVSIYATHHDPEFFPEPQMFKPERFLKENAEDLIPYTFQAFSGGPRLCLGQRFAMAEMKICMAKLMRKFRIKTCPSTDLKFLPGSFLGILGFEEIFLTLEPRN